MSAKRTTLPPELMAEWADSRPVEQVAVTDRTAQWQCYKGHVWNTRICARLPCPSHPLWSKKGYLHYKVKASNA